jgi:hypothetical protein
MSKYDNFRTKTGGGWKKIPAYKVIAWVEQNFEFKTRKDGSEYLICDPFTGDTGFNFNINPEYGVCHSWHGDEWAGPVNPETNKRNCSVVKFIKVLRKCSYREALSELLGASEDVSSYLRPEGRVGAAKVERTVSVALPGGLEILATSKDPQAKALRSWLKSRGYTKERMEKAELYHIGMDVYWPYFEFEMLVYWQARSRLNKRFEFPPENIYDDKGEIVGKTEGTKGDFFYGFDEIEPASYVIITEAIFDQNTLLDQCLASGGADLTPNQVKKLKIIGPRKGIILSPDNDNAGISSVVRNRQVLDSLGFPLFCSIPPKLKYEEDGETRYTKDWNEIGQKVVGFENVRKIHDDRIRKLNTQEVIRLKDLLSKR